MTEKKIWLLEYASWEACEDMMGLAITRKYRFDRARFFYLPTEVVVREPQIIVPTQGRYWEMNCWYFPESEARPCAEFRNLMQLREYHQAHHGEWEGSSISSADTWSAKHMCYIVEHWDHIGDDGHTEYELRGYRLTWGDARLQYLINHDWRKVQELADAID